LGSSTSCSQIPFALVSFNISPPLDNFLATLGYAVRLTRNSPDLCESKIPPDDNLDRRSLDRNPHGHTRHKRVLRLRDRLADVRTRPLDDRWSPRVASLGRSGGYRMTGRIKHWASLWRRRRTGEGSVATFLSQRLAPWQGNVDVPGGIPTNRGWHRPLAFGHAAARTCEPLCCARAISCISRGHLDRARGGRGSYAPNGNARPDGEVHPADAR
jgi:hypothetical protein